MVRKNWLILLTAGCIAFNALGAVASADPFYYFVDADTSDYDALPYHLEFAVTRDHSTADPTDNAAQILSFATAGTAAATGSSAGTILGDLKTGLTLTDQTNGGSSFYDVDGTFGSEFSYVVALSGSQFELAQPVAPGGFAGFTMFLDQGGTPILLNPAGFGASTEIYRDGVPPEPAEEMEVSTHLKIPVNQIVNGSRGANPNLNTVWSGGSGAYSDSAHWSQGVPQIVEISDTVIDVATPVTVTLHRGGVARNLTLTAGNTLDLNTYGLTLSGRLINDGVVNADGTLALLFDSRIEGGGVTNATGTILAKENLTVEAPHTINLSGAGQIVSDGALTNDGLIEATNAFTNLIAKTSIVNNGTLRAVSDGLRLRTPLIENNGLMQSTGPGATIDLNFDGLPVQTITGTGDWDVGNGMNVYGKIDFTTTGEFRLQPDSIVGGSGAAGSSFTASTLAGGGGFATFSLGAGSTVTILEGNAATPFSGNVTGGLRLIKNGLGTQVLTGENTYSGGTEVNGGTLRVDHAGSAVGYGLLEVNDGGTLAASGNISSFSRIYDGGALGVGDQGDAGRLQTFGMRLYDGSELNVDLAIDPAASDLLSIANGDLHIGDVTVNIADAGLMVDSTVWFMEWSSILFANADGNLGQEFAPTASEFSAATPAGVEGYFVVENSYDGLNAGRVGFAVTAIEFLAADFDHDGNVDGDDLAAWEDGFGASGDASHGQGDADEDADVDGADFLLWQRQLGSGPPDPAGAAVPEPSAIWLALGAAVPIVQRRLVRRR